MFTDSVYNQDTAFYINHVMNWHKNIRLFCEVSNQILGELFKNIKIQMEKVITTVEYK